MTKIGIIAGSGKLPLLIGRNLIKKKYQICFFCIKNYANLEDFKNYENIEIEIVSFSKIIKLLKDKNINQLIMAGRINRPSLKDLKFDFKTVGLIKDYFLESKGDDELLKVISNFFLKQGYPLFDWKRICEDLFSDKDYLTNFKPSKDAINNKNKGLAIFKKVGQTDIGQSLVVQNQLILGIECLEGTDELIKRCSNYKKSGSKSILLKLSKYNQHHELDLPTIGLQTFENLNKYNYEGIFIEKNKCVIIEKEKIINFCNENNLFLSTINKID